MPEHPIDPGRPKHKRTVEPRRFKGKILTIRFLPEELAYLARIRRWHNDSRKVKVNLTTALAA